MKIRNGFVSNSSSSSFAILCKNTKMSKEELVERTLGAVSKLDYELLFKEQAEQYAEDNEYVVSIRSVSTDDPQRGMRKIIEDVIKAQLPVDTNIRVECLE